MHFRQYVQQISEIASAFSIHTVFSQEMQFFLFILNLMQQQLSLSPDREIKTKGQLDFCVDPTDVCARRSHPHPNGHDAAALWKVSWHKRHV